MTNILLTTLLRLAAWHQFAEPSIISVSGELSNLLGFLALAMIWDHAGPPGLGTITGGLVLFGMPSNFAGYLHLLPCFRSDGVHLLAHLRAARLAPAGAT